MAARSCAPARHPHMARIRSRISRRKPPAPAPACAPGRREDHLQEAVRHIRPVFRQETVPGLKWRPTSIASGPAARVSAAGSRLLTDAHVTLKPRFCVALIALALAGGSAGPSFAQSMSGGGAANPNASRTTLDPIPEGGWEGGQRAQGRPTRRRHPPDADRVAGHRPYRAPAQPWRQRHRAGHDRKAPGRDQGPARHRRTTDVPARARPGRPAPHGGGHRRLHRDDHQLPRIAGTLEQPCRSICGSR